MLAPTLLLAVVLADFSPYVRARTTKDSSNAHCLWWNEPTVTFQQNVAGNPATGANAFSAITTSFATWQVTLQQCAGLTLTEGPRTASRKTGLETTSAPNQNVVLFRSMACSRRAPATAACWKDGTCNNAFDCWDHSTTLLGITTVSYQPTTGRILDADIELNAANNVFTAVDTPVCGTRLLQSCVAVDIQNTVTHEIGHFLGLDHTQLQNSTMNAAAGTGETSKRSLDVGTRSFACEVYPRSLSARDCVLDAAIDELGGSAPLKTGCSSAGTDLRLCLLPGVLWFFAARSRRFQHRRHARPWAHLAAVLMLAPGGAQATTLLALDIEALAAQSDLIVRARVVRVEAQWAADHSRIWTHTELQVSESWKGTGSSSVVVVQPGGTVGDVGQLVAGTAHFEVGEEVIVLLEARGPVFTVAGFAMGKYRVRFGGSNGWLAEPEPLDAVLIDPHTGRPVERSVRPVSLEALKRKVDGNDAPQPGAIRVQTR